VNGFIKIIDGSYVNLAQVFSIYAIQDGPSNWNVEIANVSGGSARVATSGSFATEAAAELFIRDLVHGFDASTW
jgi:hypothetical protein